MKTTTVELTSKHLKFQDVLSKILVFLSMIVLFTSTEGQTLPVVGIIGILIGTGWYTVTRVRIWWNHA